MLTDWVCQLTTISTDHTREVIDDAATSCVPVEDFMNVKVVVHIFYRFKSSPYSAWRPEVIDLNYILIII